MTPTGEPTTRWIVYIDGTEICDCNSRREAYDQLQARAQRFPGTYELTEESFQRDQRNWAPHAGRR